MKHTSQRFRRLAAVGAALGMACALAMPAWAAPKIEVDETSAVADHADILSADTEAYINNISIQLQDSCGAQIGVYTLDGMLGNSTMEGVAYEVFNTWGLGDADKDNGVLLLLAPYEADGGDYYIMRGDGLESQLSYSTLDNILQDDLEDDWVAQNYDEGTQKTVKAIADRLCRIYGVTLSDDTSNASAVDSARTGGFNIVEAILIIFAVILVIAVVSSLLRPRRRGPGMPPPPPRHRSYYAPPPPRHTRRPPPPPRGGGFGGPGGGSRPSGPRPGGSFGGPRPSGGSRPSRPSGGSSGGFRAGGGSSRGGGVGRHH